MIPIGIILTPFIVAFMMLAYQYYAIDPERRLVNVQFIMMALTVVLIIAYVAIQTLIPLVVALGFLALSLIWVAIAIWLFRKLPPAKQH